MVIEISDATIQAVLDDLASNNDKLDKTESTETVKMIVAIVYSLNRKNAWGLTES